MNLKEQTKLIELFGKGWSDEEIGQELGKHRTTIRKYRNIMGLKKKPGRGSWGKTKMEKHIKELMKRDKPFYDYYWKIDKSGTSQGQRTYREVAEKFGVTHQWAMKRVKRYKQHLFGLSNYDGRMASEVEKIVRKEMEDSEDNQ
jgi:IS30 family transposase